MCRLIRCSGLCDDDNDINGNNNDTSHLHYTFQSTVTYIILFHSKNAPRWLWLVCSWLNLLQPIMAPLLPSCSIESYSPEFFCSGKSPGSQAQLFMLLWPKLQSCLFGSHFCSRPDRVPGFLGLPYPITQTLVPLCSVPPNQAPSWPTLSCRAWNQSWPCLLREGGRQ